MVSNEAEVENANWLTAGRQLDLAQTVRSYRRWKVYLGVVARNYRQRKDTHRNGFGR